VGLETGGSSTDDVYFTEFAAQGQNSLPRPVTTGVGRTLNLFGRRICVCDLGRRNRLGNDRSGWSLGLGNRLV